MCITDLKSLSGETAEVTLVSGVITDLKSIPVKLLNLPWGHVLLLI